ncbi:MAG: phosphoribosylglycinamide formyltransferase [Bacteroidetes bacterium]|nr:MAG: phosphoribosylglycinamide formyltransferase [Bacteroidota bacterium]
MKRVILFASGGGTNVQRITEFFKEDSEIFITKVYVNNPDAYVLQRAKALHLPSLLFDRKDLYETGRVLEQLVADQPDLIVLAGFLWLIPPSIIQQFPNRIVNIHPALLPQYGGKGMYGMHVHKAVIAHKEKESGITIHLVNEQYDEGDILFQATCPVSPEDTPEKLAQKIHSLEYENFPNVIQSYLRKITP